MRLGMLLALLLLTACGAGPADPRPPAPQREQAGTLLAPYALSKAQVGHVLRYLDPPRGFRVTDYCLDGESERCDLVLDDVRWSSYTTLERRNGDWLLVGVVRHDDPDERRRRCAASVSGCTGRRPRATSDPGRP